MKSASLVPIVLLVLGVAVIAWVGSQVWQAAGTGHIPLSGWIAIILGILATAGLGGGLMALMFYSSRRGYDDRAAEQTPTVEPEHPTSDMQG